MNGCALILLAAVAAPPTLETLQYERRETREATRAATLANYRPALTWGPWHVIGPFDNSGRDKHAVVYAPEVRVDLGASHAGRDGRAITWKVLEHEGWGPIDLKRFGTEADNTDGIAYLYREIDAAEAHELAVQMGSDDGLKAWLNGRLVVDADAYRGLNVADHELELSMSAGRNTLLVKVTQGVGAWQFQMRPKDDGRLLALLEYRLDQDFPPDAESRHYRILTVLEPEDIVLEVGGLEVLPDGRPAVATRRGEVWLIDGAYDDPPFDAVFSQFAWGLHEPLGARWIGGDRPGLYLVQRGELTRLGDTDRDDRADLYETVSDRWGVSGNYHEFAFGPKLDGDGRLWITLCVGFCGSLGKSTVPWRGWALIVNPDGSVTPVCGGLRSPNGIGRNAEGDMFYTDNQGDWVGTNKLAHLDFGDYHGHPSSHKWYPEAGWPEPTEADFKPPAVWFPYGRMGQSASDIQLIEADGRFGPFDGQLLVGDQTNASIMRVDLQKVNGQYQGACFPFRSGFDCGVNRLVFAPDGSLFVGLTNRGWGSLGRRPWGLQRCVYTGVEPFEVLHMRVEPAGFVLTFTQPVDPVTAARADSYELESFTYHRHEKYGSPEIDRRRHDAFSVTVSDGRTVRLAVPDLREGYVHELRMPGVRNARGEPLLHDDAYYTLNALPRE